MPKMKHYQGIAGIRNHLQNAQREYNHPTLSESADLTYNMSQAEVALLQEDIDALNYLLACQLGVADKELVQTEYSVYERIFNRAKPEAQANLADAKRIPGDVGKDVRKLYKLTINTCDHYLEKLKDPVFLSKLPKIIKQ